MVRFLIALLFLSCGPTRYASFNIANGAGFVEHGHREMKRVVIESANPDVIGLQEVDLYASRSYGIDTAQAVLGEGWYTYFSKTLDFESDDFHPDDVGLYGIMIASRFQITHASTHVLPGSTDTYRFVMQTTIINNVRVLNTHLHWGDKFIRRAQLEYISKWVQPDTVLLGDFNQTDFDILKQATKYGLIDQIRTDLEIVQSGLIQTSGSDHPLVWADIK